MKIFLTPITLACLSLILSACARQDDGPQDSASVTTAELLRSTEAWRKAYNNNDLETLAAFYTEDADYVSTHVPGLMIHGREQIKENFGRGIAGGGHLDSVTVQRSGSSCDLAYLVCAYQATNSGVTVQGKNVLVMKRVGPRWLIVTHASIVRG